MADSDLAALAAPNPPPRHLNLWPFQVARKTFDRCDQQKVLLWAKARGERLVHVPETNGDAVWVVAPWRRWRKEPRGGWKKKQEKFLMGVFLPTILRRWLDESVIHR